LFLLEPLGYKPKLSNAYHAVMSGYIINYTFHVLENWREQDCLLKAKMCLSKKDLLRL
jgi:hypothetical protein